MSARIDIDMTVKDAIIAMSDGNPGAIRCLCELIQAAPCVDPDSALMNFGPILMLDTLHIYGSRIYMLWSDVCERDIGKVIAILRAFQLGQLGGTTEQAINHAIDNRGDGLDLDLIVGAVQATLPNFNPEFRNKEAV